MTLRRFSSAYTDIQQPYDWPVGMVARDKFDRQFRQIIKVLAK
jgi:hypothetical protein